MSDATLYERDPAPWNAHLAEGNATQPRKGVSVDLQVADEVLDGRISGRTAAIGHIRRSRAFAQSGERARIPNELRRARALLSDGIGA
jgi:hypothetical protein